MTSTFGTLISPAALSRMVASWLEEDCPAFDVGGLVVGDSMAEAVLWGKSKGVLAGVPFFNEVFKQLDCTVEWLIKESDTVEPVVHCATVRGPVNKLLLGERVALNVLARCSGIASKTQAMKLAMSQSNVTNLPILAGTRKTTPGFRVCEKYAMVVGGADPHRYSLSTMTMLKDNHIASMGSVENAVLRAREGGGFSSKIDVEVSSVKDAMHCVDAGVDVIMLDNFDPGPVLEGAVSRIRSYLRTLNADRKNQREVLIEISGGVDESNIKEYCLDGVDIISTSAIHQGVKHLDFSLKIRKPATESHTDNDQIS